MPLASTEKLVRGKDYTFRFRLGSLIVTRNLETAVTIAYSHVDRVRVSHTYFDPDTAVQFTWIGPDSFASVATVAGLLQEIISGAVLGGGAYFLGAEEGRIREAYDVFGPGNAPSSDEGGVPGIREVLTTVAVILGVGVAAFAVVSAFRLTPQIKQSFRRAAKSVGRIAKKVKVKR